MSTLGTHDLFRRFAADDLAALGEIAVPKSWASGATIFQRGDEGDGMIVVTDGRVRLSLLAHNGREISLKHAGPGEILGEIALLDGGPRSADATAMTRTHGSFVPRAGFQRLIDRRPGLLRAINMYLCQRLRDTNELVESLALLPIEAHLARFMLKQLALSAIEDEAEAGVSLAMPQSELAALIGASRPKLNRVLVAWEKSGLIVRSGQQVRCKIGALRRIAFPRGD
jgi:CRP-like cAMP-binding protein